MAVEALQRRLHEDDVMLERTLADTSNLVSGEAQVREGLLRMQQSIRSLRMESAALPADQRERANSFCTDFEGRLKRHDLRFQASKAEAAREKLLPKAAEEGLRQRKQLSSKEESDREQLRNMSQARDELRSTFSYMSSVSDALNSGSDSIHSMKDKYGYFGEKLDAAAKLLGDLKRRSEEDTRYIWWSFLFFLSVVAWIVLRRLKVFKMMYYAGSWTWWSGSTVASLVQRVLSGLAATYKAFCDLVGIPNIFEDG